MAADAATTVRPFPTPHDPPAGMTIRHLNAPDDLVAMNAIANAIRQAEGQDFYTTDEQFAKFYADPPGTDPATDVAIVEAAGKIVGYGRAAWHQEVDGPRVYEVIPFIDPAGTGVEAFGALVDALEARLRVIAADHPAGEKVFETFGGNRAARARRAARGPRIRSRSPLLLDGPSKRRRPPRRPASGRARDPRGQAGASPPDLRRRHRSLPRPLGVHANPPSATTRTS